VRGKREQAAPVLSLGAPRRVTRKEGSSSPGQAEKESLKRKSRKVFTPCFKREFHYLWKTTQYRGKGDGGQGTDGKDLKRREI